MKIRQDARWPDAHIRLKKLYDARVPDGMSQEQFGAEYKIGSQGMVWQYLSGYTPLNYDAAAKFAEGLRCTIKDISPEMDREIDRTILPALGLKAWRRAAVLALLAIALQQGVTTDANASFSFSQMATVYYVKCREFLTALMRYLTFPDAESVFAR